MIKPHYAHPFSILGFDPGIAITGFGLIQKGTEELPKLIDFGVITTSSTIPLHARLQSIRKDLDEIIASSKPDAASVEKIFFAKNTKTAIGVAHARGVLLERLSAHHIPIFEYTPLEIKQSVTGFGRANKQQVMHMVRLILDTQALLRPDDAVDAIASALCHLSHENDPTIVVHTSL